TCATSMDWRSIDAAVADRVVVVAPKGLIRDVIRTRSSFLPVHIGACAFPDRRGLADGGGFPARSRTGLDRRRDAARGAATDRTRALLVQPARLAVWCAEGRVPAGGRADALDGSGAPPGDSAWRSFPFGRRFQLAFHRPGADDERRAELRRNNSGGQSFRRDRQNQRDRRRSNYARPTFRWGRQRRRLDEYRRRRDLRADL